jgi:hypothetical protein
MKELELEKFMKSKVQYSLGEAKILASFSK